MLAREAGRKAPKSTARGNLSPKPIIYVKMMGNRRPFAEVSKR
jgi:hypothetical protein